MRKSEVNICQYCKWSNLHTCTDRSCEEAILAAEKVGEQMNRLTYKNPNGTWGMNNGYDMTKVPSKLYGALYKLKDYEETGLSPEQIIQLDEIYLEKCEEINKLKKEIKEKEMEKVDMRANEYQKLAMRTCSIPYDQKEYQGHKFDKEHMKKELGDCLWMIAEACNALDFDLGDVMQTNIDKLKARFPEGFSAERSINRVEGDV